jgi:hypothetical protein
MRTILILLAIGLLTCNGQKILEKHNSPTGDYVLQVELDNSKANDEHVGLRLLKKNGDELDYVRTISGDHMKWAIAWYDKKTIIMDSHDVGTLGWTIENNRLRTMNEITRDMEDKCIEAFRNKYGTHGIQH